MCDVWKVKLNVEAFCLPLFLHSLHTGVYGLNEKLHIPSGFEVSLKYNWELYFGDNYVTWLEEVPGHALDLEHFKQIIKKKILARDMKLFCSVFAVSPVTHELYLNPKFNLY